MYEIKSFSLERYYWRIQENGDVKVSDRNLEVNCEEAFKQWGDGASISKKETWGYKITETECNSHKKVSDGNQKVVEQRFMLNACLITSALRHLQRHILFIEWVSKCHPTTRTVILAGLLKALQLGCWGGGICWRANFAHELNWRLLVLLEQQWLIVPNLCTSTVHCSCMY